MRIDLFSLVIKLIVTNGGSLRRTPGRLAHAAFLRMVETVDSELAAKLHVANKRRPFTISPLNGFAPASDGRYHLRQGDEGWLRVTLLDPLLFNTFIQYFINRPHTATITLNAVTFAVTEVLSIDGSHTWAGVASVQQLFDCWQVAERLDKEIALYFETATSYNRRSDQYGERLDHRYTLALPLPEYVFGGLARMWDQLTGHQSAATIHAFALDHVTVSRHAISTRMVDYGSGKRQIGFQGKVEFEILDRSDDQITRHLHRLADLAFFTGCGSKTSQGMGQVRRR